jgi:calcium/calmodulin-dependent protein kinase I
MDSTKGFGLLDSKSSKARLPDLVRDSQLDAEFRNGITVHTFLESDPSSHQRTIRREESWVEERHVGAGGFGSIWLEKCTHGPQKGAMRAVKKIPLRPQTLSIEYIRELEAAAKFSHRKVCFSGLYC